MKHVLGRLAKFITGLAGTATIILFYRYMLRLATPRADWWQVVEWGHRLRDLGKRGLGMFRVWLLSYIGLTQWSLTRLRDRYQRGEYGEAGT